MMDDQLLPIANTTPVSAFDCHVILTVPSDDSPVFRAVVSNLPTISAEGPTERECLQLIVGQFKEFVRSSVQGKGSIDWETDKLEPQPGQQERWIPVHL